jgi:hypothetical protein
MAANPILPRAQSVISDGRGVTTKEWYDFFLSLLRFVGEEESQAALIQDILNRLKALEDEEDPQDAIIQGLRSIQVNGTLENGLVQITLKGDAANPGNTYYYGTGPDGVRGFYPVADALVQGDGITLTVGSDGKITIAHADTSSVADISASFTGGTVPDQIALTFDEFGHVLTRTISGRTLDHNDTGGLQGGNATERYHFTAAEHDGLVPWASEDVADHLPTATGSWSPTFTPTSNIDGTPTVDGTARFFRVGDMLSCILRVSMDPTTAGSQCVCRVSLPVPSTFSASGDCIGHVGLSTNTGVAVAGEVRANIGNNEAQIQFIAGDTTSRGYQVEFTYVVL